MNWYYVNAAGQQAGPVDDATLEGVIASGAVHGDTLVWREGMANWQSLREARPGQYASAPVAGEGAGIATGIEEAVCSECGGVFPVGDTIRIGGARVCAKCKPAFVQKMREGVMTPTAESAFHYAGFWIRVAAKILDMLLIGLFIGVPMIIFMVSTRGFANPASMVFFQLAQVAGIFIQVLFTTFFHGRFGATPGKMVCKIMVVKSDGSPITYGRAFGRAMAEVLSGLICDIGYIITGFDSEKRSLHDHICNTRVIYK